VKKAIPVLNHSFGIFVTRVGRYLVIIRYTNTLFHGINQRWGIRKRYDKLTNVDNYRTKTFVSIVDKYGVNFYSQSLRALSTESRISSQTHLLAKRDSAVKPRN